MGVAIVPPGAFTRLTCAIVVCCLVSTGEVAAFPTTDATTPSIFENPSPPTESDLRHQLQLQTGIGAAAASSGAAWTYVPALGAEEFFTDNVLQSPTNPRWDLVTVVTPSIAINGDEPNARVNFNYAPQLRLDARTPSQNGVTQQLSGDGHLTIVPDAFYIDVRALAGGTPIDSGFGGFATSLTPSLGLGGVSGAATTGLSKQNTAQTTSVSVTPYWLHRFGDFGTAKIGYEINESSISQNGGGVPTLLTTGGVDQHSLTNQALAQFETGEEFAPYRYMAVASGGVSNGTGVSNGENQFSIRNRLGYSISRTISVYGELGYEWERFGGTPPTQIDDTIWGFGTTWQPNADSQITIGYGHQNGTSGVQLSAYYALTARTRITASYVTGLQTDVGQLQDQLDLSAFNQNGSAVDAQTGAPQFNGLSGVGVQNGLFKAKTFSLSATTSLNRDDISFTMEASEQTTIAVDNSLVVTNFFSPVAPPVGSTSQGVTGIASWTHSLREDLLMNSSVSYGVTNVSGGTPGAPGTGRQTSIGASVGLQYTLTPTLVTNVRYAYFRRGSSFPDETIYQNVFLVGINKQF